MNPLRLLDLTGLAIVIVAVTGRLYGATR